jgi:alanine dehydrogenase
MIIGVPKEVKDHEDRVGVTPAGVKALSEAGHKVLVETQAGAQSGFSDDDYQNAGAEMVGEAGYVWGKSEMVVKVKEPIEKEYVFFREGLVLFTYLHLAPVPVLTEKLLESKVIGIAYETVRDRQGTLPLLTPMSEVAGRMSVQVGARRARHSARRCSGRASGACHHHRRRHRGHQCGARCAGLRRQSDPGRCESRPAPRTR